MQKIEQMESKVKEERDILREKIDKMNQELETFSNLDNLKTNSEGKKKVSL